MEVVTRCKRFLEESVAARRQLEESEKRRAELTQKNTDLEAGMNQLRQKAEDAEMRLATSNSRVDELENKVADLELASTQSVNEVEFLKKNMADLAQKLESEQKMNNLLRQKLIDAEIKAIQDFRKSNFFEENLLLIQGSAMEVGQRNAIEACAQVHPDLNREDPRIAELFNPQAAQEFDELFQRFVDGADLRDDDKDE